jgi:hypothetical protein
MKTKRARNISVIKPTRDPMAMPAMTPPCTLEESLLPEPPFESEAEAGEAVDVEASPVVEDLSVDDEDVASVSGVL